MDSSSQPATLLIIVATVLTSMSGFSRPELVRAHVLDVQAVLRRGERLRLLTSGAFHADWTHLLFNMISLYFFGTGLEARGGVHVLLAVYVSAVLGGSLLALLLHRREDYRALGASGGVCGVIFAAIFYVPGTSVIIFPLPVPIPASIYALAFVVGSVWAAGKQRDGIGHDAHLGGALVGLLVGALLRPSVISDAPVLFAAVLVLGAAGVVYLSRFGAHLPGRRG